MVMLFGMDFDRDRFIARTTTTRQMLECIDDKLDRQPFAYVVIIIDGVRSEMRSSEAYDFLRDIVQR